ncbi:AraC family transcriptional regulator [Halioglobus sp. HI00S01]|uniref:AraC family transcriptional regulator n=1 Tax=Halioglobus sp. HI00S01 TaxID=1822214 RepID=UPI0012E7E4C3|nr:AraC family transcriptional regulator [Halioglobus sp. HI00S01]
MPALEVMAARGHDAAACLDGTGLCEADVLREGIDDSLSREQECRFYENVIRLSGDPSIGLELGDVVIPERYGLFGYALLSAETFERVLVLAESFGPMAFSFFSFGYGKQGRDAWFELRGNPDTSPDLTRVFVDRGLAAAARTFRAILGQRFYLHHVLLPHASNGNADNYLRMFQSPVSFSSQHSRLVFDAALLEEPLLNNHRGTSLHLEQQCQLIMARLSGQGRFVDSVRMQVLSRPGVFPDIDVVANSLGLSTRTLKRRLRDENTGYREIVDELRYGLALEYLGKTRLPMEQISTLLGYRESANFSHAFKRWEGRSPSIWRRENTSALPLS